MLEQDDVIGEPSKASQHHVFVSRQLFTRTHRGLPLALQDRDIIEHLRRGFSRRLPGSKHGIPQTRNSQWSGFDVRCRSSRESVERMSNPKLHQKPIFAGGPLILTFAKVLV